LAVPSVIIGVAIGVAVIRAGGRVLLPAIFVICPAYLLFGVSSILLVEMATALKTALMSFHSIVKVTLRSTNFERTQRFYTELFGWKFRQYSPTYLGFEAPSGIEGGFQRVDTLSQGDSYLLYILVEEFESYLGRLAELGGSSSGQVEVVPGYGEYVRFYDPDGNRLALWRVATAEE